MASVRDADRIIGLVEAAGKPEPRLILNRLRAEMVRRGDMMDVADVLEVLGIELLGIIPEDEAIIIATNKGEPAVYDKRSRAGVSNYAAQRVLGEEIPLEDVMNLLFAGTITPFDGLWILHGKRSLSRLSVFLRRQIWVFLNLWLVRRSQLLVRLAKERLKVVLVHDRLKLNPELLEIIREEILSVVFAAAGY